MRTYVRCRHSVLHADLDAFYAAVEQRDDPRLYRRPVIVGGGVVLACCYEAKRCGVRSGMGGRRARALCPYAAVVPPRISAYVEASRAVFAVLERHAPMVEALSIDEAFLDVRGQEHINGTPREIAERIRREVREQVGLPISVGVARTKFLAKMASAAGKPDGLLVVEPGEELGVPASAAGGARVGGGPGDRRQAPCAGDPHGARAGAVRARRAQAIVGRAAGRHLHALANGHDPRPVRVRRRRRSIGAQRALGRPAAQRGGAGGGADRPRRPGDPAAAGGRPELPAGAPVPSSAFILESSSSTSLLLESCLLTSAPGAPRREMPMPRRCRPRHRLPWHGRYVSGSPTRARRLRRWLAPSRCWGRESCCGEPLRSAGWTLRPRVRPQTT